MINFIKKLFKNHSVVLLDKNWKPIEAVSVKHIPRHGEYIFLTSHNKYYAVLNVVYNLNNKQGIFIILEELGNQKPTH